MRDCNPVDSLSDILGDVPDLVFAYSTDGTYLYVNKAAAAFLGVDALEVIGQHWRDMGYSDAVMEPLLARVAEVAETCEPTQYRTVSSPERGSRTMDLSLTPLRCDGGDVFAVLAIAHDISEFY